MDTLLLEPTQIKVRDGLDRFRKDMGGLEDLAKSFQEHRQIVPIIITRDHELIDGGRRLAACVLAGMKVKCVYEDVKDDFELRTLELEANLHRKDFTPAEETLAIEELHRMHTERFGEGGTGTTDGWTMENTASKIGKTRNTVKAALEMAELIKNFPELRSAKTKNEIKKAGRALEKLKTAVEGMKKNEQLQKSGKKPYTLHLGDAVEFMQTIPDSSVDLICTDPLYGIDADKIVQNIGAKRGDGAFSVAGYTVKDDTERALFFYKVLAHESFRFTSSSSHGYIFVGPEHFWTLRSMFMDAGWRVHVKPLIWIKRTTGQCNIPSSWPASCYEMLMYIRKDASRLVQEGQPDWVECNPVNPNDRTHPYEKPVDLIDRLLKRICLPGQSLLDPFMGSGAIIEAGLKNGLICTGVDINQSAYAFACERMTKL